MLNWYFGWSLILAGFASGAGLGLFFHRDDFAGGYASFRRRLARLGHIALVALGLFNVVVGQELLARGVSPPPAVVFGWIGGGLAMPIVCFLSAWRPGFRCWFFVPVVLLIFAAIETLRMGPP